MQWEIRLFLLFDSRVLERDYVIIDCQTDGTRFDWFELMACDGFRFEWNSNVIWVSYNSTLMWLSEDRIWSSERSKPSIQVYSLKREKVQ